MVTSVMRDASPEGVTGPKEVIRGFSGGTRTETTKRSGPGSAEVAIPGPEG